MRAGVLGNEHRCGDDKISREDGAGRGWNVARKNREIERAGFFKPHAVAAKRNLAAKRLPKVRALSTERPCD